jgi:HTH-type transcriptional regulator, sugar sensing transcriptional regulator
MIESVLQEIGLTQNEVKVYLALLELGESKTGEILKESGLNSGRIYEILDSLQKKGLVSYIVESGVKLFSPADPRRVKEYLNEKKKAIEKQEVDYNTILPELLKKVSSIKADTNIEVFIGLKGLKTAWQKEFSYPKSQTIHIMGVTVSVKYTKPVWDYFANIHRKKRENLGYKVKKLLSVEAKKERRLHEKKAEVKYLPYGSMVAIGIISNLTIISIVTENPTSITIESEEVAKHFKEQFQILWGQAK